MVEDTDGRGPAAVRNIGWRRAKGELVCFLDDDVTVDPGWARAMLAAHEANPEAVLQGRTAPQPDEAPHQDAFSRSRAVTELDWNYPTCNIAYPRALLERLGGFDEAYRYASAEDTDLGWRAREVGRADGVRGGRARMARGRTASASSGSCAGCRSRPTSHG